MIAVPSKETLNSYSDDYLKGATRGRCASTKRNYQDAFRPVRERLGTRTLQSITKADVEDLQRSRAALAKIHKIAWCCEKL
jgi:hypothetical protein